MSPPPTRRWEGVYNALRTAMHQRELAPGDTLPTEHELAETHGVGRAAVRHALQRLEERGLITRARGPHGRTVRDYAPLLWNLSRFEMGERRDDPDSGVDEWAADMREQGRSPAETVDVEPLPAPADIASYLNVDTDTWLIRRRRLRYADNELISIADTWLLDDVAKSPATSDNGTKIYPFMSKDSLALPGGLIRAVGINQVSVEDLHYARRPSPDEAELLNIYSTDPIAEVVRVGIDDHDRRFRAMVTVSPGHRLAARYVLRVGGANPT